MQPIRIAAGASLGVILVAFGLSHLTAQPIESRLEIYNIANRTRTVIYHAPVRFEAPNWSRDGKWLIFNQDGKLYTISSTGSGAPAPLDIGDLRACNNDHGLSPDGTMLAASCNGSGDQSAVYVLPSVMPPSVNSKAPPVRYRLLTPKRPSYWHGWSPDGKTLAYVGQRDGEFDIYTMPVDGGDEVRVTTAKGLDDGPDYTPDGKWIYFNSERSGVMRIWRMHPDGNNQEMVTRDEAFADWFPHPSPDGKTIVFLSYKADVKGHPPDHDVVLRMMGIDARPKVIVSLFGGQGTINVPSWSPDSKRFAFVSYQK
jgi:TolB protein